MKLCVVNFWEGAFDGDFFDFFFRSCFADLTYTTNPHEADLVVTSVFGNVQTDPAKTLSYIGENIRPSYIGYSHSLSFDYDTYGGRNHRLPLWYSRLAWDGFEQKPRRVGSNNHGYEPLIPIKPLLKRRKLDMTKKDKFCALIAGNPEGLRINLFHGISKYKQVDGYGNMFGRSLRQSKFDVLPEYKFCLCPENSIYDGYITEKLIDAYAGGTIPIYSCNDSVYWEFNEHSFLNYQSYPHVDHFVNTIKVFEEDADAYKRFYEEPLLLEEPKLDKAIAFVRSIVK
ncbi:MAG: glycosyltransferase family 10 [Bacteroidota bacterium]